MDDFSWLDVPVEEAARRLLGCELVRTLDGEELRVRIVETEAYDQTDPASHTHHGRSTRNDAMFLAAGHAYVYQIHTHHCLNMVTGVEGFGSGVLLRAAEPLAGIDAMATRRGRDGFLLTNGPGKLCQALGITLELRGHDLGRPPLQLVRREAIATELVAAGPRIGITKNAEAPRRFCVRGNPWVSRPWPR